MGWPADLKKVEESMTDAQRRAWDLLPDSLKPRPSEPMKATDAFALVSDILGVPPSSARMGTGLNIVGAAATGIGQYQESTAQSTFFKTTDAVTAGFMDWAIGSAPFSLDPTKAAAPWLAVADFALGQVTKEVLGVEISASSTGNGAAHALNTFVDGVIRWDEEGMQSFHEKSLNGDYGMIIQGWSMIGEVISQNYEFAPIVVEMYQPISVDDLLAEAKRRQGKE